MDNRTMGNLLYSLRHMSAPTAELAADEIERLLALAEGYCAEVDRCHEELSQLVSDRDGAKSLAGSAVRERDWRAMARVFLDQRQNYAPKTIETSIVDLVADALSAGYEGAELKAHDYCACGHARSLHPFGHSENIIVTGRCVTGCGCQRFVKGNGT